MTSLRSVFFSHKAPQRLRRRLAGILSIENVVTQDCYLGSPSNIHISKKQAFASIEEKVASRIKGWKEDLLSQAGKEVLIKPVAMAVPVYSMTCFKLPSSLCKNVNGMIAKF